VDIFFSLNISALFVLLSLLVTTCDLMQSGIDCLRGRWAANFKNFNISKSRAIIFLRKIERLPKGQVRSRTGHEGPEGEQRYSYTFSLTSALEIGTHCGTLRVFFFKLCHSVEPVFALFNRWEIYSFDTFYHKFDYAISQSMKLLIFIRIMIFITSSLDCF
jgi:hypothetical protein